MRRFIQGVSMTVTCLLCLLFEFSPLYAAEDYATARREMIELIEEDASETAGYIGKAAFDTRVLEAMARVPRHLFVPSRYRDEAYENTPLPIDHGQTISQPYIVALMTNLLDLLPHHRVLEVGTGSGYQAADHIPPPLVSQLKAGGRMAVPVGSRFMIQQLVLLKKDAEGKVSLRQIVPVRFVPLTGDHRD